MEAIISSRNRNTAIGVILSEKVPSEMKYIKIISLDFTRYSINCSITCLNCLIKHMTISSFSFFGLGFITPINHIMFRNWI